MKTGMNYKNEIIVGDCLVFFKTLTRKILISGNMNLYSELIKPICFKAKDHNEEFIANQDGVINILTNKFVEKNCNEQVLIYLDRVIKVNRGNYGLNNFI